MAVVNSDAPSPPVQLNVAETAQPEPSCDRLVSVVTQFAASGLLLRVSLDGAQLEVTQQR